MILATDKGKVRGFERNGNIVFYGIPYGGNCDGAQRFLPPRECDVWDGVLDCSSLPPKAIQGEAYDPERLPEPMRTIFNEIGNQFSGGMRLAKNDKMSENCLYLNVVAPKNREDKHPVIFYIHGGAYGSGNGDVTPQICDRFVQKENVTIVSVNHRLNAFGYLYLGGFDPAYASSGLSGQMDLILALKWVQRNISVFGGDPGNVTLLGESGGGMKISTLLAMPEAEGLYHKAIIMSGAERAGIKSVEEGHRQALDLLGKLGIPAADWRKLLTIPAQELCKAVENPTVIADTREWYCPVADGEHLSYNQSQEYEVYPCSRDIPVMVGASEDELSFMGMAKMNPEMTMDELREALLGEADDAALLLPYATEEKVDELITAFRSLDRKKKSPCHLYVHILSAAHFLGGGAYRMAKEREEEGAPVYLYLNAHDTYNPLLPEKTSWHTADLPLAFYAAFHAEDKKLAEEMSGAFAAFAREGTPENAVPGWLPYNESHTTMVFDDITRAEKGYAESEMQILEKCRKQTETTGCYAGAGRNTECADTAKKE